MVREFITHVGSITKAIPLKLFLELSSLCKYQKTFRSPEYLRKLRILLKLHGRLFLLPFIFYC